MASADADLEALIRRAGPESEAELVPVLHRRVLREEASIPQGLDLVPLTAPPG